MRDQQVICEGRNNDFSFTEHFSIPHRFFILRRRMQREGTSTCSLAFARMIVRTSFL